MIKSILFLLLIASTAAVLAESAEAPPPFGVCAHLARGDEYGEHVRELQMMREAGIRWARADFTWGAFEPEDNEFHFERYDEIVDDAEKAGVHLLPILCYDSPWAGYAHARLDAWTRYVRRVVERYGDRLRYWEVWNEPNIAFWKPKPDPKQYAALLKATYETIKSVGTDLQVVYGGTAGVPHDFIRRTLELGAGKHFDVMAIHPYCYPRTIEDSGRLEDLAKLRATLKEFGATQRIWITETGWPTHHDPGVESQLELWEGLLREAARRQFPHRQTWRVAIVVDPEYPYGRAPAEALAHHLTGGRWHARTIPLAAVDSLNPEDTDVLVALFGEQMPRPHFASMRRFVQAGGLLAHFGGVPLYYAADRKDGVWQKKPPHAGDGPRRSLHMAFEAFWTRKGLPEKAPLLRPAAEVELRVAEKTDSTRWLTGAACQPGDQFVPLLEAYSGEKRIGCPGAVYLLRSDGFRGAVLSCTLPIPARRGVDRETEAAMAVRAYLTYLSLEVEVFCWYEFRDGGRNPEYNEHNFGLIDVDLKPKPAYAALRALTRLLGPQPRFDGPPAQDKNGLVRLFFTAADGRRMTACWAASSQSQATVQVAPGQSIVGIHGQAQPGAKDGRLSVGLAPIFIVGR